MAFKFSWGRPLPTLAAEDLQVEQATVISWYKLVHERKNTDMV